MNASSKYIKTNKANLCFTINPMIESHNHVFLSSKLSLLNLLNVIFSNIIFIIIYL